MSAASYTLIALVLVPILAGFALLLWRTSPKQQYGFALLASCASLILSIVLILLSDLSLGQLQHEWRAPWLPALDVWLYIGVDGLSMALLLLNCFITPLVILMAPMKNERLGQYLALFLMMSGLINGVFISLDGILFYVFFEAMLIPMFLIIGIWGGQHRIYATVKFFLYTFFGSVFFLIALIYLYLQSDTFAIPLWWFGQDLVLSATEQTWLFLAFVFAFGIKVPMWPVHTWLPDAHVQAPTGGSVILAALTLKVGAYGFFRFILPIVPLAVIEWNSILIGLALIAIVYIGFVAIAQDDMKKLIAYSSVAHMGFVSLGVFMAPELYLNGKDFAGAMALNGAFVQLISHGLISAALFFSIGVLYDRMHTRSIGEYGGVMNTMGVFSLFAIFFALANCGLPGTSGFVAEFMIILAAIQADFWYAFIAATTLIIGAGYSLWLIKRVFYGAVASDAVAALKDLNPKEIFVFVILALAVLLIGLVPEWLVMFSRASVQDLGTLLSQDALLQQACPPDLSDCLTPPHD